MTEEECAECKRPFPESYAFQEKTTSRIYKTAPLLVVLYWKENTDGSELLFCRQRNGRIKDAPFYWKMPWLYVNMV